MPRWSRLLTGAPRRWRRSPRQRGAAWPERHRLGGTAVILQGAELGIAVDAGTGGIGIAEVPAAVGDGAGAVATRRAVGDDRVLQASPCRCMPSCRCRRRLAGAIAGEGAVAHGQRAAVVDAAAVVYGAIAGEGAVAHGQRAAGCRCRRRPYAGAIAGEGAVAHGQRAAVVDAAAAALALLSEKVLLLTVSVPPL